MTRKNNIEDLLTMAIRRERDAAEFYRSMEQRAANPGTKAVFAQLAQDELGHERFLETCIAHPATLSSLEVGPDFHVAATADLPPITPGIPPVDAIALAMKKEQQAMEFYQSLAARAADAKLRKTFEGLAKMELGHKNRLETMFVNTAYPEAF